MESDDNFLEELPDFGTKLLQEAEQILLGFQTQPLVPIAKPKGSGSPLKTR